MLMLMGRRKGEIEEWVRRIFFGGRREDYIVYVKYRTVDGEEYKPIPASFIDDVRGGYIVVGDDLIPLHRVVEIRDRDGKTVYSRIKKEDSL